MIKKTIYNKRTIEDKTKLFNFTL